MRAIIYLRVSTDMQEREGTSLETQERECLEYAESAGWTVVLIIRDVASGASLDRPGIEQVRRAMRDGSCDVVLTHVVDRLARKTNHIGVILYEAEQADVSLEFVKGDFENSPTGRFLLAAVAFVAELERELIIERTVRGKKERARSGRLPQATGKGCYGYTYVPGTGRRVIHRVPHPPPGDLHGNQHLPDDGHQNGQAPRAEEACPRGLRARRDRAHRDPRSIAPDRVTRALRARQGAPR